MPKPDDERLSRLLRAVRRRSGRTQAALAVEAGVPRRDVLAIEAGRVASVDYGRIRRLFEVCEAQTRLVVSWHGAAADRLLDERHALLVERSTEAFARWHWSLVPEASFGFFGERGSIDILAGRRDAEVVAVCEVKSELGSLEATNRVLDGKVRLAPQIAVERFGWRPRHVARILILADSSTNRRILRRHRRTMDAVYPARTLEVKAWIRRPRGPLAGVWFVSEVRSTDTTAPI